ncbi:hypothetical protein [Sphingomonas daechungensis]|uniref:hypothetical protein n=1 Tax=Sphingomonas daechungensis TaxID=1176646 RepID=UPI003784B4A4
MHTSIVPILTLVLTAAAPESAPPPPVPATNTNVGNPNEKICENITPIGSRLATKRFCGTRAEWADRKAQERQALEDAQRAPCVHKAGCP